MLICPDKDKVSIYYGNSKDVFPEKASVEFKGIKIPNDAKIVDLNNDWKSDIYFRFRDKDKKIEEYVILVTE